jgi:hypothetical protein
MATGGHGGPPAVAGLVLLGIGFGLSVSPAMTQALVRVPPERAADASGVLTTVVQLSQVIGVAGFGTLFLATHSLPVTGSWLAVTAGVSALCGVALSRSASRS